MEIEKKQFEERVEVAVVKEEKEALKIRYEGAS